MEEYLRRAQKNRGNHLQLLFTTVVPFKPVHQRSAPGCLKCRTLPALQVSGGSTMAASATWASATAVPIAAIMAAADWSSVNTLARKYVRFLSQEIYKNI